MKEWDGGSETLNIVSGLYVIETEPYLRLGFFDGDMDLELKFLSAADERNFLIQNKFILTVNYNSATKRSVYDKTVKTFPNDETTKLFSSTTKLSHEKARKFLFLLCKTQDVTPFPIYE